MEIKDLISLHTRALKVLNLMKEVESRIANVQTQIDENKLHPILIKEQREKLRELNLVFNRLSNSYQSITILL